MSGSAEWVVDHWRSRLYATPTGTDGSPELLLREVTAPTLAQLDEQVDGLGMPAAPVPRPAG